MHISHRKLCYLQIMQVIVWFDVYLLTLFIHIVSVLKSPSSSGSSSADSTSAKKEPTKADIMAEKAAAKAAQAAARERQKAAADAAALDKMIGI